MSPMSSSSQSSMAIPQPGGVNAPLVQAVDVRRIYHRAGRELVALDGINLAIDRGSFVAIMGRSGSGKSTLLNLMGCLDFPTEGAIALDGTDTRSLDDRRLSRLRNRLVGFLFQSFNLIPQMSVEENVETALLYGDTPEVEWKDRVDGLLSRLGIRDRASHRPAELSGGEAQRAALARALVNEPELLLADEPTGNLDSRTGEEVLELLEELVAEGRTLVLVTHDSTVASRAHRVISIADGRVESDRGAAG
jgi:putative ABC transport system ATP-binding protein